MMPPLSSMSYTLITKPAYEPVSVDELRKHARVSTNTEDDMMIPFIKAAREFVEDETSLKLISQVIDWTMDCFPPWTMRLPFAPVSSLDSITYTDEANTSQTLSSSLYLSDLAGFPARVTPSYGNVWPNTRLIMSAVTVRFTVGYGDPTKVPKLLRQAVLMTAADMYENRERSGAMQMYESPPAVSRILASHRVYHF